MPNTICGYCKESILPGEETVVNASVTVEVIGEKPSRAVYRKQLESQDAGNVVVVSHFSCMDKAITEAGFKSQRGLVPLFGQQ